MVTTVDLEGFRHLSRYNFGLIIGPNQTLGSGWATRLSEAFKSNFGIDSVGTYLELGSTALEQSHQAQSIRETIRQSLSSQHPPASLDSLSKIRWKSVLSCSLDLQLELKMQEQADRSPSRRSIAVITDLEMALPPREIPAFKLMGAFVRDDFPVTRAQYRLHKNKWRRVLPVFADSVRGSPVICLGMSGLDGVLLDLLAEMLADRNSAPQSLVLLSDDPLTTNSELIDTLSARSSLTIVKTSLRELLKAIEQAEREGGQQLLPFADGTVDPYRSLIRFADIAVVVNNNLTPEFSSNERPLLFELLFSPASTRFDPFAHDLDFRRTAETELLSDIEETIKTHPGENCTVALIGASATGKTTLLKRISFELARKGYLTLWLKPCFIPDPARYCRKLFDEISRVTRTLAVPVIVVLDDAVAAGSISPSVIHDAARDSQAHIVLVFGIRSVDWVSVDKSLLAGNSHRMVSVRLADTLDSTEWSTFAQYLYSIEVESSVTAAQERLNRIDQTLVRDTLSVLYWLLPQTRQSIQDSIRNEFFTLGDPNIARNVVTGSKQHSPTMLRTAYGMVAVADKYKVPLPVEVLVAALEIDYGPWLKESKEGGRIWGILYSIDGEPGDGEFYRTRNSVITEELVKTLNAGISIRSGEVAVLTALIEACRGKTAPVYREFLVRLLVPGQRLEGLEYSQGLQLYNAAISALSLPDQTILHHKGLWIKNVGRDPITAIQVLELALQTQPYPYTDRREVEEHIHTSLAAAWLDAIRSQKVSRDEGKGQVIDHLALARAVDFFNPHAVHVHAKHSVELLTEMGAATPADTCSVAAATLEDVDNAINVLRSPIDYSARDNDQIDALEQVRDEVLNLASDSIQLELKADDLFTEYKSQLGFVLIARKLLSHADKSGKGAQYRKAYDFVLECRRKIDDAKYEVDGELIAIQLQIYYRWKIARGVVQGPYGGADWLLLKELSAEAVRRSPARSRGNVLFRFLHALSLAQLNDWSNSQLELTQIRESGAPNHILWRPRALLVNDSGAPRSVQGIVRDAAGIKMIYSEELQTDIRCDRTGRWPRSGELTHAFVEFCFGGYFAKESSSVNLNSN